MLILLSRHGFARHRWELDCPRLSTFVHVLFLLNSHETPVRSIETPTATFAFHVDATIQSEVGTRPRPVCSSPPRLGGYDPLQRISSEFAGGATR